MTGDKKILALSGGVGGAKLAVGLARCLVPGQLTVVANTADDFEHLGLHISPDLDSVMYALAGLDDPARGWGLEGETWHFMESVGRLGGDTWFRLGDKDMATHVVRSLALRGGQTLTDVTTALCRNLQIAQELLPMSDDPVRTLVQTDEGELPFQHYFVRRMCEPAVRAFRFDGVDAARPQSEFKRRLADPELAGIVICPSNPYVSIDPILRLPGVRAAIIRSAAPVVMVSPIVAGQALKGPAAKMMAELGRPVNTLSVVEHYRDLADIAVIDNLDRELGPEIEKLGMRAVATDTVMRSLADKESLGRLIVKVLGNS